MTIANVRGVRAAPAEAVGELQLGQGLDLGHRDGVVERYTRPAALHRVSGDREGPECRDPSAGNRPEGPGEEDRLGEQEQARTAEGQQRGGAREGGELPDRRQAAGEQFVEHDAQAEQVAAMIHVPTARLFRAHVIRRAENLAGLGAVLGFANGVIFTKVKVPSFIVTLGMWYVGLGIATMMFGTDTMPFLTNDTLSTWASRLNFGLPNNFLLAAGVAIVGALVLRFTSFGRVTLAVGNNEEIAKGNGLKVTRTKIVVFVLAGAISGIAGIVATIQLGAVNPTIAAGNLFIALPAVVIGGTSLAGGKGSMLGTVLGVLLLTTLNNGLILSNVSPNFQTAVSGAILIIAIVATAWSQRDRLRISK